MQTDFNPPEPGYYVDWSLVLLVVSSLIVAGVIVYAFATAGGGTTPVC